MSGAAGLWERLEALSVAYQVEWPQLEAEDATGLVLRAVSVLGLAAARGLGADHHTGHTGL
jgi:hypothetical protein